MSRLTKLDKLLLEVRSCRVCVEELPLGANPIVRAKRSARVLIIGQAPGTKVHESSIPWDDASGRRLRDWMNVDEDTFYNQGRIAIMPMGFCYPGKGNSGDLPPRPECADLWHKKLLNNLPNIKLILLIGQYAQKYYLLDSVGNQYTTVTEIVRNWKKLPPQYFPLPHPSPRNTMWLRKNGWFERNTVPQLRKRLRVALSD